ncbi:MAG: hypothetical protein JWO22_987 [Frankiales bacterium]|nr:hypothetical protein [Frankiales bacterium]
MDTEDFTRFQGVDLTLWVRLLLALLVLAVVGALAL